MNTMSTVSQSIAALFLAALSSASALAAAGDDAALADLSIEELMNETVTSVSKREENLFDAAAAISVLTNDDLRRSGATTVAEALRLVPGLDVAGVNSNQTAISARGFNSLYANKLLVLVDGRSVYTPLFAGVFWDLQQVMLDDVDRIEVIRGPGATVWGANAVNGVINIVTRSAKDTQGGLVYAGGGDVHRAMGGARYGGKIGDDTHYRVFGSYGNNADLPLANGEPAQDNWNSWRGGFRLDREVRADTDLTWQADATRLILGDLGDEASNVNTIARWTRNWSSRSGIELQAYVDRTYRNEHERARHTVVTTDLSYQQTFGLGENNDLIWGLGYRLSDLDLQQTTPAIQIRDPRFSLQLFSAFVQDEFRVIPDKLSLTAGIKIEHNDFTGLEFQPSVRATFKPAERQTLWAAVSRAVRTPNVAEGRDASAIAIGAPFSGPDGNPYAPMIVGNPSLQSEVLWAYELGYRILPVPRLSVDVATFYNDYSELIGFVGVERLVPGDPVGTAEIPAKNNATGKSWGGEIVTTFTPVDPLRVIAGYTLLIARTHVIGSPQADDRSSPRHQASLRVSYDFARNASFDTQVRYVSPILAVSPYVTADLRLSYRPIESLELSLVGQNLLDNQHPEQNAVPFAVNAEVPRGIYGRLAWRF